MVLLNALYCFALLILTPWLVARSWRTGRYRRFLSDKLLGPKPSATIDPRPTVWFHGVSLGEIHLLSILVGRFRQRYPGYRCVISATTETGLDEAARRFPDLEVLPFPFDVSWAVRRAFERVRPELVVLAESELWPNFLRTAESRGVPVAVVNGRISPKSSRRYLKLKRIAKPLLLDKVSLWVMQTAAYADHLLAAGVEPVRVRVGGSVKYDVATSAPAPATLSRLRNELRLQPSDLVMVAGSTHAPEERLVLEAFRKMRLQHQNLKLVLVPRSPDRFAEVAALADALSFSVSRRSVMSAEGEAPSVVVLDTVGELWPAWHLADFGFTGGSLDGKRGGQSMIEPAAAGVPVVFGPHVWNFRDAARRLVEAGGALQISNEAGLETALRRLADDAELRRTMGDAARELAHSQRGAADRTVDLLAEVLGVGGRARAAA